MKHIIMTLLCSTLSFAAIDNINSFEADFTQTVTDDKNTSLNYSGYVQAKKPQNALWSYKKPVKKDVYISNRRVTIVEPEIEQVIIRRINTGFDFFKMVKNATKIAKNVYEANYKNTRFTIYLKNNLIEKISYKDEFDNSVVIQFKKQKQNTKLENDIFIAKFPLYFDIIRD